MDDGYSALRERSRYPDSIYKPVSRRSMAPHHRRRRWLALLLTLVIVGVGVWMLVSGGGASAVRHAAPTSKGYLARVRTLAGAGPQSLAAQQKAAENQAINRTMAATPFIRVAGSQHREIALTFDDGPGPYTPQILRILERTHVPATFFEVGVLERYFHASTSRIVRDGFVIGDHTQLHAPMSHLSPAAQKAQLLQQTSVIGQYGAPFPRLFRPPYGLFNAATQSLLRRYRMLMVLWTVDTDDYRQPGVEAIVHSAVAGARPGAIILMHDAGGTRTETASALPKIIGALKRRGYRLVTVPKLLLDNPAPAHQTLGALAGGGG